MESTTTTPQTVFDSNQMKLQHTRIVRKDELPRRVTATNQNNYLSSASNKNLREYILSQCDSKDEITESKQMLFEKHIDDINDGRTQTIPKANRFANSRNRFNFHCDQSDDCISSNYPNSSRSTVRDFTASSLSSAIAPSTSAIADDNNSTNLWKESDIDMSVNGSSVCPSENFDHDHHWLMRHSDDSWTDRERKWKMLNSSIIHDSIEEKDVIETTNDQFQSIQLSDCDSKKHQLKSNSSLQSMHLRKKNNYARGKSVESTEPIPRTERLVIPTKFLSAHNTMHSDDKRLSQAQRIIPGYTREHLLRAEKFGSVIEAIKKPGHHVGPAKNPDCACEHCRRWFVERKNFRERASSLDITFISRPNCSFKQKYDTNYIV